MSLAQVAKLAGVSAATVSRVLRRSAQVRPETTAQVARAIDAVGYKLPAAGIAGGRRRGRSSASHKSIAIITVGGTTRRWLNVPVVASFVAAVTEVAHHEQLSVLLGDMSGLGEPSRLIQGREIGGAILLVDSQLAMDPDAPMQIRELSRRIPLVWAMGGHSGQLVVDRVAVDGHGIGQMAATYLGDMHRRRIVLVTDSPRLASVRACASAFVGTAYDRGVESSVYVLDGDEGASQVFGGQVRVVDTVDACVRDICDGEDMPDGIFSLTDDLSAALYPRLAKAGLLPGRDLCFVSCDSESNRPAAVHPRPTMLEVNTAEIATRTLRRLRSRMARPGESPVLMQVPPILCRSSEMERNLRKSVLHSPVG